MGSGGWSQSSYNNYVQHNVGATVDDNFKGTTLNASVSTRGFNTTTRTHNTDIPEFAKVVGIRQSCENEEHPISTPCFIAIDGTGSMRRTPHLMLTEYFPGIMNALEAAGVPNPQIMFMVFEDVYSDNYPAQVTEYESDPEKLLKQLQTFVLEEGCGGANGGESYSLPHIIAGYHTELDSWYKRGVKGNLITIGDEPNHPEVPGWALEKFLGYEHGAHSISAEEALAKAREQYHVSHIHIDDGSHRFNTSWYDFLGEENVRRCHSKDIVQTIVDIILGNLHNGTIAHEAVVESSSFDMRPR